MSSSDPVLEIQIKIKQLEKEAEKRQELSEASIAHNEATVKSFGMRCMATAVAWVTSETIYHIVLVFASQNAHEGGQLSLKPAYEFVARLCYAILACLVCPALLYVLRPEGGATTGYSFIPDFMKLVAGCIPMILGWSLMDMLLALMKWANNPGWDELIAAVVLTVFISLLELLSCYKAAKAGVDGQGAGDTLCARYLVLPASATLAVGRMWNTFMEWPISALQGEVAGKPNLMFMIQLVYWAIMTAVIIQITAWWSTKQASLCKQIGEDEKYHLGSMEHHALDMERSMGSVFVGCLSFVYAWTLNSTVQDFWFTLMCGCPSAPACGYPNNCAYAVILTVIFTAYATTLQFQDRREPWGKAHQSLVVLAMSLCVGWAWKGYFIVTIKAMNAEVQKGEVFCFLVLFFVLWAFGGIWWHTFLKEQRRRKMQRDNDHKKTKVVIKAEDLGSSYI